MEDIEKQIEEAAEKYMSGNGAFIKNPYNEGYWIVGQRAFSYGVRSEIAKQYWQQGLYTLESVRTLCGDAWIAGIEKTYNPNNKLGFEEWFEQHKRNNYE